MGRFNLLDEPWILVLETDNGEEKKVSLKELFLNAQHYRDLAGDMKVQDFAILRLLLAVIQTVFSRFDADGQPYEGLKINDRFQAMNDIEDEEDQYDYSESLRETWKALWQRGEFPSIVQEYLEAWRDHFYLFDAYYPFCQVLEENVESEKIHNTTRNAVGPTFVLGKTINRLISESGHKIAIFSPKYKQESNKEKEEKRENNKDILTCDQIARWLITYQGYTGNADKALYKEKEPYDRSFGWLFELGGLYLKTNNLFETLLLNCLLVHPKDQYVGKLQRPCWEYSCQEILEREFSSKTIDNLAELYTFWSRAIYIDPSMDVKEHFSMQVVKLPDFDHQDFFLEPMTLWKRGGNSKNKEGWIPKKHDADQSLWRSFGLLTLRYDPEDKKTSRLPILMDWYKTIQQQLGDVRISIAAISMEDNGNRNSFVPVDEIYDTLKIDSLVLGDDQKEGWISRINDAVTETKFAISHIYGNFIRDIQTIRNINSKDFVSQHIEEVYFLVDQPFRNWLGDIRLEDSKDEKIFEWRKRLKGIILAEAQHELENASNRDYIGVVEKDHTLNIATAYNKFKGFLNKFLKTKEAKNWHQSTE